MCLIHDLPYLVRGSVSNPASWTKFTQDNLSKALQEEHATSSLRSERSVVRTSCLSAQLAPSLNICGVADAVFLCLRMLVEQLLLDTTEDLRVQCSGVDRAFSQRCVELIEAKTQLEMKLAEVDSPRERVIDWLFNRLSIVFTRVYAQVLGQIGAQERNIVALQQAIHNKEAPMRVAQSRLYLRSLRPNMELCRDAPQLRYVHLQKPTTSTSFSPSHLLIRCPCLQSGGRGEAD